MLEEQINKFADNPDPPVELVEVEPFRPVADRCWASHISAAGGAAAVGAVVAMNKDSYGVATVLTAVSGLADKFDGDEARRFAARHPIEGAKRAHRGAIEDKIWDKFRNTLMGGAIALDKNYSKPARIGAGLVAAREAIVGISSLFVARKFKKEGVPIEELDSMPSSPTGKETMWEFGLGEGLATLGVIVKNGVTGERAKGWKLLLLDYWVLVLFAVSSQGLNTAKPLRARLMRCVKVIATGNLTTNLTLEQ